MVSLYARLFRYRSRPDREPLEDFLSEALADLLGRMMIGDVVDFLDYAFRESGSAPVTAGLLGSVLEWRTQEIVPGGIMDIVLFANGKPRLVIENKTWSGFQDHSTGEEEVNQLHTYGRWLMQQCPEGLPCGILLITGTTSSPSDFHGNGTYAVSARAQITWAGVGRWLSSRVEAAHDNVSTWSTLARDLVCFIKEKKLSSEIFVASDVSAADLMLPTMDRWKATFDTIWQGGNQVWSNFLNPRVADLVFNTDAGMIWHWRYSQIPAATKTYVGLGIRFPEQSNWYRNLGLPSRPHFIIIIGSDRGNLECLGEIPTGWIYDEEDGQFVLARETDKFGDRPDRRVDQLQAWAKVAMNEARSILNNCRVI